MRSLVYCKEYLYCLQILLWHVRVAIRKPQALAIVIGKISLHCRRKFFVFVFTLAICPKWQQSRTDFPLPCSSSRFCVFQNESNYDSVDFPPTENSNTYPPGILLFVAPYRTFFTQPLDTINNKEMYEFWWTNKRSYTVQRDLLSCINMVAMTLREQDPLEGKP